MTGLPWVIEDAELGLFLVNKQVFVDPEIFAAEKRKIYDRCWLYLGHETEIAAANSFVTRRVAGRPVIFKRDEEGRIHAFINSCLHNGAIVCRQARGTAKFFSCAYHGWVYDGVGNLVEVPGEPAFGKNFRREDYGLRPVPRLESYRGFVFICFDPDVMPLVQFLGKATFYLDLLELQDADGMEVVPGTHLYSSRANWKMLPVNVIDGNHFLPTHSTYLDYLGVRGHDIRRPVNDFKEYALGNGHTVFEYDAPWGRPLGKPDPAWGEAVNRAIAGSKAKLDDRLGPELADRLGRMNRNLVIFPNLIINDIMGTTIRVCEPMAPDYMEVTAWEIAPKNEPSLLRAIRHDNFLTFLGPGGFATPDDIEGMESSQRGYAAYLEVPWATYSKGMEVPDGEQAGPWGSDFMMRSYWRHWANTMGIVPVKAPEVAGGPRTKSENAAA